MGIIILSRTNGFVHTWRQYFISCFDKSNCKLINTTHITEQSNANKKRDGQCSQNVIFWRFRVTTVAQERQQCVLCILQSRTSPSTVRKYRVALLGQVAGNNRTYLVLHVEHPKFLSDFNHIWIIRTDFHNSLQYQISRKSNLWEPHWYNLMDWRTDMMKLIEVFREY